MHESIKGPKTSFLLDLTNPQREMFQRNGENPELVIMAVAPFHNDWVTQALARLHKTLEAMIDPDNIIVLSQAKAELKSGEVVSLSDTSLLLSMQFPTQEGKLMVLDLQEPERVVFH